MSRDPSPLVSVIMAVKDGERFLAQAIDSVLAQDYSPYEVLVVDGHSRDRTAEIARSFAGVRVVPQRGAGVAGAYNTGIDEAAGELVAFLSHDDLWAPGKLSAQVGYLRSHPEIDYVTARVECFLEPGCAVPPGFRRELLGGPQVAHIMETLLARKSVFERVGRFDPEIAIANDVDWFARAGDCGIPTAVVPEVLVRKRIHDANTSMNVAVNNRDLLEVVRRSLRRKRQA